MDEVQWAQQAGGGNQDLVHFDLGIIINCCLFIMTNCELSLKYSEGEIRLRENLSNIQHVANAQRE